jgi:hypothetical protein
MRHTIIQVIEMKVEIPKKERGALMITAERKT